MSTNNEPTNELATNSLQAQSIDCVGTTYVKPVMWRTRLASVIALLIILLGVFLYSQGLFSIGIALITVCLACLAILGIIVRASAARFMGYRNTACEDTPLGRYLSSDKTTIRLSTPTLSDKEAATAMFAERQEGVMTLRRGFTVEPGQKVLITEDVFTTGGSAQEVVELVQSMGGNVIAAGSIIDSTAGNTVKLKVPFQSLIKFEFQTFDPSDCPMCKQGIPAVKPGSRPDKK